MEVQDCAFPTVNTVVATDEAKVAFRDCNVAMLVGARPRGPGMERKDLLMANAQIFSAQGKALDAVADRDVQVLVVGNPANTNSLIAQRNAPGLKARNFTAMTRLDHNRRRVAARAEDRQPPDTHPSHDDLGQSFLYPVSGSQPRDRGRQSSTLTRGSRNGLRESFIPVVQQRGAAVIKARGASSAASAASAAIDHVRDWVRGTAEGDWVSMARARRRQLRHQARA